MVSVVSVGSDIREKERNQKIKSSHETSCSGYSCNRNDYNSRDDIGYIAYTTPCSHFPVENIHSSVLTREPGSPRVILLRNIRVPLSEALFIILLSVFVYFFI